MLLALLVFMNDALRVANQGVPVIRQVLPTHFNWPLFLVALGGMAAPVAQLARAGLQRGGTRSRFHASTTTD